MDSQAQPPVTMLSGYATQQEAELTVHCHDKMFSKVTVVDGGGKEVFRVDSPALGTSWSWRRRIFQEPGHRHMFDLRHESLSIKNGWLVETPDGDRRLCSLLHKSFLTKDHSAINATVRTEAGEQVLVAMRPRDRAATSTTVAVGDVTLATIDKFEDNDLTFLGDRDRSVWKVHVASGVDMSLIMVMVLCRAEMGHVWRQ